MSATPILSADNPARLSRAEYRVCLLLSYGKTVEKARQQLDVTMVTLRKHLKNIYAKIGTTCLDERLYRHLTLGADVSNSAKVRHAG